jgi:5'-nucleotidase
MDRCRWLFPLTLLLAACAHQPATPVASAPATVPLRLLAINDFHGNLEPTPSRSAGALLGSEEAVEAGGIAGLAGAVERLGAGRPHRLLVAAGDLIGASPVTSALLRDEPSVQVLGRIGLQFSAVGNHEFDRGLDELRRIQHGGCVDGVCADGQAPFAGAAFEYLAANVFDQASGQRVFAGYRIVQVGAARIALIGALVRSTPELVAADAVAGLRFDDEADSVNALVPAILAAGVRAIVLLIHDGATAEGEVDPETCDGLRGPLIDIATRLDPEIDVVVSGHSHRGYICRHNGRLLTQAGSYGHLLSAIDLELDPAGGPPRIVAAANHWVDPARPSTDPEYQRLLAAAKTRSAEVAGQPVAQMAAAQIPRRIEPSGESMLGRVIADAQLQAARGHGARIACMNPGGVRQSLPAEPRDGPLVYADIHAAQPFGNDIVVLEASGAELLEMLEQQWQDGGRDAVLSCSQGFSYRYDRSRPPGQRVLAGSVRIDDEPLDPERRYRLAVNSFLAGGGDGIAVLRDLPRVAEAGLDRDALIDWLQRQQPLQPPSESRLQRVGD